MLFLIYFIIDDFLYINIFRFNVMFVNKHYVEVIFPFIFEIIASNIRQSVLKKKKV